VFGDKSKILISNGKHTISATIRAKKLIKLAIRDILKSPLTSLFKNKNKMKIKRTVCMPKGIENCLTTNAHKAKIVPMNKILLHLRGILAITKANVVTALCSGIPCKRNVINELIESTLS